MKPIKLLYIVIYIVFLMMVMLLIISVHKLAGRTGEMSIFAISSLILGSLLFGMAFLFPQFQDKEEQLIADVAPIESSGLSDASVNFDDTTEQAVEIDVTSYMPQKTADLRQFSETLLINISNDFNIVQGVFYGKKAGEDLFESYALYAYFSETKPQSFKSGETIPGQAVKNKSLVCINNVPDSYMTIASGLGKGNPKQLVFVPIQHNNEVVGLIEFASFEFLTEQQNAVLEKLSQLVAANIVKLLKK